MICLKKVKRFCKEDYRLIENYDKAIADTTQTWECHHRDEIRILPSGMVALRSTDELKEMGRYFNCPANELIFLTRTEHKSLHGRYQSAEKKAKISNSMKGRPSPQKGRTASIETRAKMSASHLGEKNGFYGKKHTEESLKKMSETRNRMLKEVSNA